MKKYIYLLLFLFINKNVSASHFIYENKAEKPITVCITNDSNDTLFYATNFEKKGSFDVNVSIPTEAYFNYNSNFDWYFILMPDTVFLTFTDNEVKFRFNPQREEYENDYNKVHTYLLQYCNPMQLSIYYDKDKWQQAGFNTDTLWNKFLVMFDLVQDFHWLHFLNYSHDYRGLMEVYHNVIGNSDTSNYPKYKAYIEKVPVEYKKYIHYQIAHRILYYAPKKYTIGDNIDTLLFLDKDNKQTSLKNIAKDKKTYFMIWDFGCGYSKKYPPEYFEFLKAHNIRMVYIHAEKYSPNTFKEICDKTNYNLNSFQSGNSDILFLYKIGLKGYPFGFLTDEKGKLTNNNLSPEKLKEIYK